MASHTTRDHEEIRQWAEAHGATPTVVSRTGGMLRFEFAQHEPATLADISWDDFFRVFDERGLELVYDDKPGSRFHKLVYPETVAAKTRRRAPASARATRSTGTTRSARSARGTRSSSRGSSSSGPSSSPGKVQPIRAKSSAGRKAAPKAKPRTTKATTKRSSPRRPRKAA